MVINFSVKNLLNIAFVAVLVYICYTSFQILIVTLFGIICAYMANPAVELMMKYKVPRFIASLLVMGIWCLFVLSVFSWIVPEIIKGVHSLGVHIVQNSDAIVKKVSEFGDKTGLNLSILRQYIREAVMGGYHLSQIQGVFTMTFHIMLIPVIAFMVMADYPSMIKFLDKYFGLSKDKGIRKYINIVNNVFSSYFRKQFAVMVILSSFYSISLLFTGLSTAILLGCITGILSIIPYFGFTLGIALSISTAILEYHDIIHPLYVVLAFGCVQLLKTFIVIPKVVGSSLGLHPVVTVVALLVGGSSFGFTGMVFALPVTSICLIVYKQRYAAKVNPDFTD